MLFPADLAVQLAPRSLHVERFCRHLLRRWAELDYAAPACRDAMATAIEQFELDPALFDLGAIERGDRPATDALLFDAFAIDDAPWAFSFYSRDRAREWEGEVEADSVSGIAGLIEVASHSDDRERFRALYAEVLEPEEIEALIGDESVRPPSTWPRMDRPGIYRREHASLVFHSGATTIVTDPQGFAGGWTTNGMRYPGDDTPVTADGICLTHTHGDHWHLPSMLRWKKAGTTVLCPPIERRSLLSPEDPAASCRLAGLLAESPPWWSRRSIGDIDVSILPFFGEQPVRRPPALEAPVRNWGSCYRFAVAGRSTMILVDSGSDPMGDAIAMIERSVAEDGPVDLLMSCCLSFPEALNAGLPTYLLTIPFGRLREIHEARKRGIVESMTLGAEGVVQACRAARARFFLPYAHGFAGVGKDPRSAEGGGQEESAVVAGLRQLLAAEQIPTKLLEWAPGDSLHWEGDQPRIDRASRA